MNVLSLFDGMSCGQIALNRAGVKYDKYYASEIDKHAIAVTQHNYPNTKQLGDVTKINTTNAPKIDLLIGGSPCQSFSFAGTRVGMKSSENIDITTLEQYLCEKAKGFTFIGTSYLFWEYVRILKELKPRFFLLENVVMAPNWEQVISETLGIAPIKINSSCLTAHNRKRLYWTNLPFDTSIKDKVSELVLKDVLSDNTIDLPRTSAMNKDKSKSNIVGIFKNLVGSKHLLSEDIWTTRFFKKVPPTLAYKKAISQLKSINEKSNCLTTSGQNISNSGSTNIFAFNTEGKLLVRPLNRLECERLQTVPEGYTLPVSDSQAKRMLGNGWTVDVIAHIFKGIECNSQN